MTDTTELVARLKHAMTTMANDDLSAPHTDKRARFVERMAAMRDCADALEALTAELDARDARIRREERERCAQVAKNRWRAWKNLAPHAAVECDVTACEDISAAIRAMGDE